MSITTLPRKPLDIVKSELNQTISGAVNLALRLAKGQSEERAGKLYDTTVLPVSSRINPLITAIDGLTDDERQAINTRLKDLAEGNRDDGKRLSLAVAA